MAALDLAPNLAERVRGGTRAEPFRGTVDLPNVYPQPLGPGWALVGDAGCHGVGSGVHGAAGVAVRSSCCLCLSHPRLVSSAPSDSMSLVMPAAVTAAPAPGPTMVS